MTGLDKITALIDRIIVLMMSVGETDWLKSLESLRRRCDMVCSEKEKRGLLGDILGMYGGMGGFSDLVLFKGDKVLFAENEELDCLRRQLFDAVRQAME
jgi:hypothetical protein